MQCQYKIKKALQLIQKQIKSVIKQQIEKLTNKKIINIKQIEIAFNV